MGHGIETTVRHLARSKNLSAARLLEAALSSTSEAVRREAGRELATGRGGRGIAELIRHFDPSDAELVAVLKDNRDKVIPALRATIIGKDPLLARNALRIAQSQQFYELIPILLSVFIDRGEESEEDTSLSEAVMKLVSKYVQALEERRNRRLLYNTILPEVLKTVDKGLKNFHRNDPDLILRVFLSLYPYIPDDLSEIADIVRNPSGPTYLPLHHLLLSEREPFVYAFVFYCLDNDDPPPIATTVFSKRSDVPFLSFILRKIAGYLSKEFERNLSRIQHPEWMNGLRPLLDVLSEDSQIGLITLVRHMRWSEGEIQSALLEIFQYGRKSGRLEALHALMNYPGERINQALWQAADDPDPEIQTAALTWLRKRDPARATSKILQYADSPDPKVRETVQKLLPEFRFKRFLETFDQMSEEQRRMMFKLIRKTDPQTVDELAQMLILGEPMEKAKALLCVAYGDLAGSLEESLCGVLSKGESPALRSKAAELLADGRRELSRGTLVQALHRDPSPEVRAAAKSSLERRPAPWEIAKTEKNTAAS